MGALAMDVPEEPGAVFALLAVFVVVGFLFLLGLSRGRLSERQQTVVWVAFTALFFCVCSVLVHNNAKSPAAHGVREAPSMVEANQAGAYK
jgi:H+/Cl- antiporter ClcA